MISKENKKRVIGALKEKSSLYPSAAKMAVALGINPAQLSRIKKGETEKVLSDAQWISIARRLDVELGTRTELVPAQTDVFNIITAHLKACQQNSISGLLCDHADIGKTYTAKYYVKNNPNAVYIDCSQNKRKQQFVRAIAREFGVGHTGKYKDVYDDLVFYLRSLPNPLIIIDEAGDLSYEAFLELKALWNATEYSCGWYMMGADGLKAKIERAINNKKVGYAEIFSRYGNRYQKITPDGREELDNWRKAQVATIAKANGVTNIQQLFGKTQGSLRRIYIEIQKMKTLQQ